MKRVSGHRAAIATKQLWQAAVLTAAGAVGVTSHAEAALYYWSAKKRPTHYRRNPPSRRDR
jgi:hypothetical protein